MVMDRISDVIDNDYFTLYFVVVTSSWSLRVSDDHHYILPYR